jgi:hypothetical protein
LKIISTFGISLPSSPFDTDAQLLISFHHHYPLKFNRNVVWSTILQDFAERIGHSAESLRDKFVYRQDRVFSTLGIR